VIRGRSISSAEVIVPGPVIRVGNGAGDVKEPGLIEEKSWRVSAGNEEVEDLHL